VFHFGCYIPVINTVTVLIERVSYLINIRLYATLCFNYFQWHRRMFSYGSVLELLIC